MVWLGFRVWLCFEFVVVVECVVSGFVVDLSEACVFELGIVLNVLLLAIVGCVALNCVGVSVAISGLVSLLLVWFDCMLCEFGFDLG